MIYLGGKTRMAKEILPLILADRKEGQYFVEPFYDGHKVYISEYQAPEDFAKIWEKPLRNNMSSNKRKATEKLFIKGNFKKQKS